MISALRQKLSVHVRTVGAKLWIGVRDRLPEDFRRNSSVMKPVQRALSLARKQVERFMELPKEVILPSSTTRFEDGPPPHSMAGRYRNQVRLKSLKEPFQATGEVPKVAALILSRNGAHHLEKLFESIALYEDYPRLELWLMDHGSTDRTKEVVQKYKEKLDLRAEFNPRNDRFSVSNNRLAEMTDAPLLLLLNNDIVWVKPVLKTLVSQAMAPETGLVAPILRFPPWHSDWPSQLQHAGIKFFADVQGQFFRPYNLGAIQGVGDPGPPGLERFPAVTAACALIKRTHFERLGGLDPLYNYGYEDVDFALRLHKEGYPSVLVSHAELLHDESATRRLKITSEVRKIREENRDRLMERFGYVIRRGLAADRVSGRFDWGERPLQVAFAVTETGSEATAGDAFTALELGRALQKELGFEATFLAPEAWYELSQFDVVIAMVDRYNPGQIRRQRPHLLKVAWMRNWFDRWVKRPGFDLYELLLCSSKTAIRHLASNYQRQAYLLRIGTNPDRFRPGQGHPDRKTDVVFTGHRWDQPRDIERCLDPSKIPGEVSIYGQGWEEVPHFEPCLRGPLPYAQLPEVYRATQIVVDDANHATRRYGSVNSRVFDALASGKMVVTNGEQGAREIFGDALVTYNSEATLTEALRNQLRDKAQTEAQAQRLRKEVLSKHTYAHRAREFQKILESFHHNKFRIAIKIAVPSEAEKAAWGDYHFAIALRKAFWKAGHSVRIDLLPLWETQQQLGDDLVLVLRGLSEYKPKPYHINVMWNISHPNLVESSEYESYDHVFIASASHAETLARRLSVSVSPLLQCTDPDVFFPQAEGPAERVLFVGNSRRQRRPAVVQAIETGLCPAVYGGMWDDLIEAKYWKGHHVPNESLAGFYASAGVVLNDHWPDMKDLGFLSNRLFDAGACGALLVSDPVRGLQDVFGDTIATFSSPEELKSEVEALLARKDAAALKTRLSDLVRNHHTFEVRSEEILKVAEQIRTKKELGFFSKERS